jgi:fatty acid desaturase
VITRRDFDQLRRRLDSDGAFSRSEARSWAKVASCTGTALLLALCMPLVPALLAWLVLAPLASVFLCAAVTLGHEAGPGAAAETAAGNERLILFAFGFLGGVSPRFWRWKHNTVHHRAPNVPGVDRDLRLGPVALSSEQHQRSGRLFRFYQRNLQGWLMWPITAFTGPLIWIRSTTWLVQNRGKRGWGRDVAALIAHWVVFLALPMWWFGALPALLAHLWIYGLTGFLLGSIILLGHTGLPLVTAWNDPWSLQVHTTRDVRAGRVGTWLFSGLDFQMEHHLFPGVPSYRLALAHERVRPFLLERGLPVHVASLPAAVLEVTRHLFVSWKDEPIELT